MSAGQLRWNGRNGRYAAVGPVGHERFVYREDGMAVWTILAPDPESTIVAGGRQESPAEARRAVEMACPAVVSTNPRQKMDQLLAVRPAMTTPDQRRRWRREFDIASTALRMDSGGRHLEFQNSGDGIYRAKGPKGHRVKVQQGMKGHYHWTVKAQDGGVVSSGSHPNVRKALAQAATACPGVSAKPESKGRL